MTVVVGGNARSTKFLVSFAAPTTSCRTSVGVAVLDGFLYAVGGQDGVQCLNHVERYDPKGELSSLHELFNIFKSLDREQMEQSGSNDNKAPGCRRGCFGWIPLRDRRLGRTNAVEHRRALRSAQQQVDGRCSDVDEEETSRLCCLQQLYLCRRRTRRLHGIVIS